MKLNVLLFLPFLVINAQHHLNYDGSTGVIYSPNYPAEYDNSADYEYTITVPTGNFIHLTFFDFLTEDSYDTLTIENVTTLSGDQTGYAIDIQASQATLTFTSDLTHTYRGFAIQYDMVPFGSVFMPTDQCAILIQSQSYGIVTSPNYPDNYPDNKVCGVLIQAAPGHLINLTFLAFNTEDGYDIVTVYDNDSEDDTRKIGDYSGKKVPDTITSTSNNLYIKFSSDLVKNFSGFSALYTSFASSDYKRGVLPQTLTTDSILTRENKKLLEWLKKKAGSNNLVIPKIGSN